MLHARERHLSEHFKSHVGEDQEPEGAGREAGSRRRLGQETRRGTGRDYPVNAMSGGASWVDYILTAAALAAAIYALRLYKNIER
ncbi:MAG: hypothetical protein WAK55_20950 [Xanthobacteraceae bacterium]